ncbi:hypothetical protein BDV28DRAFT_143010 [Aspergillus coremiiformis]|uniref:Fungal-specific transcription factor domain-containing protein n=1 Tax=Aspergillus coremiiformis TaxID=138285 RepID=A0A5N6YVK6_9EURO|nr:hypothetical protein BDV28DRAFT_143010 [Aspergillus coremiiformis]
MDYSILDHFIAHIISAPDHLNPPPTLVTTQRADGGTKSDLRFGMNDGLWNMIQRTSSLHARSRTRAINHSTTITEAVGIWQDLDHWQPPDTLPVPEYQDLYDSYSSAIFTWLYLILHPDSMGDEKVQAMVERGLTDMSAVTVQDLFPFLLIPLFIHGLASVQEEHRDFVSSFLDHIEENGPYDHAEVYRTMVEQSWDNQDQGMRRSWEWIQWGVTDSVG